MPVALDTPTPPAFAVPPDPVDWELFYSRLPAWHRTPRNVVQTLTSFSLLKGLLAPNLHAPVFILGSPRSGTTFLGRIVGSLPEFSFHNEPDLSMYAVEYVLSGMWSFGRAKQHYRRAYAALMRSCGEGHLRFAEKTPRNCLIMPWLDAFFSETRFIHVVRDARDVTSSMIALNWMVPNEQDLRSSPNGERRFRAGQGRLWPYWVEEDRVEEFETTDAVHRSAWRWRVWTERVLRGASNLPDYRYFQITYERMIEDPDETASRLLDFLEIDSSTSRDALLASIRKARPDSVGRWKQQLEPNQVSKVLNEAGQLMRKLGYDVTD